MALLLVICGLLLQGTYQDFMLNTGLFALSGGITNWLAVHMLFEKVPGIYGSGVIPLRFEEFKLGIRNLIMEQFFDEASLATFLNQAGDVSGMLSGKLREEIANLDLAAAFEALLDVIMASSFASMLGMLGGRDALQSLKQPFIDKLREYFQQQFDADGFEQQVQAALNSTLDQSAIRARLEQLIDRRLQEMSPQQVKVIIQSMIRQHLGWLVVWGAVFGGLIGLLVTLVNAAL